MNENVVLMKINAALNVLRGVQGIGPLPAKYQRQMPLNSIQEAIRGLEIAKAEINGEPWPAVEAKAIDADLEGIIDN